MQAHQRKSTASTHATGKQFRRAVVHTLSQTGSVNVDAPRGWLVYNDIHVAIRYSKCLVNSGRVSWFYGLKPSDCARLRSNGALLLVAPHLDGHRFVLLSEKETVNLLPLCGRDKKRGDLKIHLLHETGSLPTRLQEWPELDLKARTHFLTAEAIAIAGLPRASGLSRSVDPGPGTLRLDDVQYRDVANRKPPRQTRPLRRSGRAFASGFVPTLTLRSLKLGEPALALARREQSHRAHQRLVEELHLFLKATDWMEVQEIAGAIDLWARHPRSGLRVIFECKSMTTGGGVELERSRSGLAQLLEYRFFYGESDDALCLVTNDALSPTRVTLLEALGIGCISIRNGVVECLGAMARLLLRGETR